MTAIAIKSASMSEALVRTIKRKPSTLARLSYLHNLSYDHTRRLCKALAGEARIHMRRQGVFNVYHFGPSDKAVKQASRFDPIALPREFFHPSQAGAV